LCLSPNTVRSDRKYVGKRGPEWVFAWEKAEVHIKFYLEKQMNMEGNIQTDFQQKCAGVK
jgi:hypothetical protein